MTNKISFSFYPLGSHELISHSMQTLGSVSSASSSTYLDITKQFTYESFLFLFLIELFVFRFYIFIL
jgi:hypothetical protein